MTPFPALIPFESAISAVTLPRFQTKSGQCTIDPKEIIYLRAMGNYTIFHLAMGEQVVTTLPLITYVPLLEEQGFMRLHKSYLLNLHFLKDCRIDRFFRLTLPDQCILQVARRRRMALKKIFDQYKPAME
ncbi:LytTR family DNA-binding domain-containing protein [Runella sp.]|uniref:LytTR family DNA-binding domain-containing protein n=1 Tax=Runella sp. TaxID=1960881 RepID=UPI003D0DB4A6